VATTAPKRRSVPRRIVSYTRELWRRREFALYLGFGSFSAKNATTALGLVWWVLNPLLLGGVYFLIFGLIFGNRTSDFLVYLMAGMFVFQFSAQALTGGAHSIIQNSKLLENIRFPRLVLPISKIVESALGFIASLGVLMVIALIAGEPILNGPVWVLLFAFPMQLLFNVGLAAFSGRLAVPFRDITNVIPYFTRIWLYLSPIIWTLDRLEGMGETVNFAVQLNPMFHLLALYRAGLLGYPFEWSDLGYFAISMAVIFLLGVGMFVRYEKFIVRDL
jgi:teichoic acid transport system permease protein